MRRRLAAVATLVLVGSGLVGPGLVGGATAAPAAGTGNDLVVDLGSTTGPFYGGASGALYGLYDQDVPTDNLIDGMGLRTTDTKAQDGQQHPGSDALEVAKPFTDSGGHDLYIYMTDVYRNFPYERTSYEEYQGYLKTQVEQILTSPYQDRIVLVPYNEPDGNWFAGNLGAFNQEWNETYHYLKSLWPQARIAGPNYTHWLPDDMRTFLTYCQANGCLPDVVTWHELSTPASVRSDVAAYRSLESSLGLDIPANTNEYAFRYQLTNPAQMVGWLSALEDSKVDGALAYWNINGSLGDSVAQQNVPNAQWWLYHWYSSMTGDTVQVTAPQGDAADSLQGVASLDTAKRQARIVLGGGPPGPSTVVVKHVDPAVFGRTVHVTLEQDPWTGMTGAASQPTRLTDTDVTVGADGTIRVPVDLAGPAGDTSACTATGDRVTGELGNAVPLCGNGEYVELPSGVVSGLHDYTISAWVNPSQNSTWSRIFDFGTGTDDNMFLTLNDGSGLRFAITTGGSGDEQRIDSSAGVLPTNRWSHVAVTLSGNTGTLYVDGKAVGSNDDMTLDPAALGTTTRNYLGKSQYSDPYLSGAVDDFQIYDRALSAAEVADLAGGAQGAGDVASYRFDETGGAVATDSSGNGADATIVSDPAKPPSTSAYQIVLAPGGTGSDTAADATWTGSYEAESADITGDGWNINTEGTASNLSGFATSGNQDVGGLRTGSSTVLTFPVDVPATGDYRLAVFDGSDAHASDVDGPTNVYARVDGGDPHEVWLPAGYEWPVWNYGTSTLHLTRGAHRIALSTVGADGAATRGDAIIDKIDLTRLGTAGTVYEAEQADLSGGARTDYAARGQSGAGAVTMRRGQATTFWVYADRDGYTDLSFRYTGSGSAGVSVDTGLAAQPVDSPLAGGGGRWSTRTYRLYLGEGVNKVTVTGHAGSTTLDRLTATPDGALPASVTYQAEDAALTGTATVDGGFSQAHGGVVTGVSGGADNAMTLTVHAPRAGRYAMTVRFANDEEMQATHYNPDLMTRPADISVDGAPTFHVNFANTFSFNQFWTLTVPVGLHKGGNTIRFVADQQYNYDGTTVGVVYSGDGVGAPLRSDTAPNIDEVTLSPFQLR